MKKMIIKMRAISRIFVLLFLLFSAQVFAQESAAARKMLNDVTAKIKSYDNIVIDFRYQVSNYKKNLNQESKGNVTLQGQKYLLNFMGVTRIFDGKKVYNIVPEDEEITISNGDNQKNDGLTPGKMLTFFNSGYKYYMDIAMNVKGRKIQFIKLIPTDSHSDVKNILLGVDSQTHHIYTLIQLDKDGTKTTFTINSFKVNQPLSKNHFTFTAGKYPNYYINRLD
ncbi:MAG: LolA family protein [Flavobacterium sp.]